METNWKIDNMHSEIGFKVKHMMITNVNGSFGTFEAKAKTHGDDFASAQFEFTAAIDSINTGVSDRDAHLKSDDFFNAEHYPQLVLKGAVIHKDGNDIKVLGDLTIRDVTKPIELTGEFNGIVVDPYGQTKAGIVLNGKINRSDFGLRWNAITEAGSIVVSDEIRLTAEMQFIKEG